MISKRTIFKIESVEIINDCMIKTASFDIPAGEKYDPDFLYIKVRAVSAGEYYGDNKNGDWFPEDELKKTYKTFLTAHVFKDHDNKSAASAIGEVLSSVWDDEMKCVVLILKVDRKIAPTVTRSIEKGYMTDVSMGCRVPYSICSICGHKAKNPSEYCDHIRLFRRKILANGKKVYEININPKFHDISVVLNGAEKVAKITDIYDSASAKKTPPKYTPIQKVAEDFEEEGMQKVASHQEFINNAFEIPEFDGMQKSADIKKRAEFHKRLNGLVLNQSKHNLMQGSRGCEAARLILKSAFTPYWDDLQIKGIALKLKALAAQEGKTKQKTFTEFLTVLDFAGIELSPREFGGLVSSMFDCNCSAEPTDNVIDAIRKSETDAFTNPAREIGLMGALRAIKSIPETGITNKIVIRKITSDPDEGLQDSIMSKIVNPLIASRSMHSVPLIKRIRIIAKPMSVSPCEFSTSNPLLNQLFSMYQTDRMNRLSDGTTLLGMRKFASNYIGSETFEKTAKYNKYTAAFVGTPIIYGYSKLQRSRINNDKEVSSVNRFVAEYPETVAGLNVLFGPKVYNMTKSQLKKLSKSAIKNKDKIVGAVKSFGKKASEDVADTVLYLCYNGYEDSVDKIHSKVASLNPSEILVDRILSKQADLTDNIEKIATDAESGDFSGFSEDGFVQTMAIAKVLTERI